MGVGVTVGTGEGVGVGVGKIGVLVGVAVTTTTMGVGVSTEGSSTTGPHAIIVKTAITIYNRIRTPYPVFPILGVFRLNG